MSGLSVIFLLTRRPMDACGVETFPLGGASRVALASHGVANHGMTNNTNPSWLEKLRHPRWRWLRAPLGAILVVFGIFGFLPVLGFWMIPLGLSILALDFPAAARLDRWLRLKWRGSVAWLRRRGVLPPERTE
jgi:hypothetical protein